MPRIPAVLLCLAVACSLALRLIGSPRAATAAPDPAQDTLAWVGTEAITAADLARRVELMPWLAPTPPAGADSTGAHVLAALVAEKLLAQEAVRRGIGADGREAAMRSALVRALARDALYRKEVGGDTTRAIAVLNRVLAGRRVAVDPPLFHLLCDSLRAQMAATLADRGGRAGRIRILSDDVDALRASLSAHLGRTLVSTPGGGITLEDALEDLRFYEFSVRSLDPDAFAVAINSHLRFMVERDLLAREALRQRLDRLPEVASDVRMWTDAWRANALARTVSSPAAIDRDVAALAGRARLRMDTARAQSLHVTRQNVLTRRVLGFGGGMFAAPAAMPLWGWEPLWRAAAPALP